MTPFAREIASELLKPVAKRNPDDRAALIRLIPGAQFFDVVAAQELIVDLAGRIEHTNETVGMMGFLPAPKTWIEFEDLADRPGERFGFLLIQTDAGNCARVICAARTTRNKWATRELGELTLATSSAAVPQGAHLTGGDLGGTLCHAFIYAALAIINSPKVINRRQHQPDRGFERALNATRGITGSFPLHAWTEILLSVNTRDASGEAPSEAHLTGKQALSFIRSFIRIRLGKIEIVRSHFRGDASIGIKRSRYIVGART